MSVDTDPTTGTEFIQTAFTTTVDDDDVEALVTVLDSIVSELRNRFERDGLLEDVLRRESGKTGIKSGFTETNQDPEPLTQDVVIEPLLEALGYDTWHREVSGASEERGNVADYSIPLDDHDEVDSSQLLIEAEPINKPLESRGHGIDQVESWLSQREFETDFGFATDGIRWVFIRYDPDTYAHDRIEWIDLSDVFISLFENQTGARDDAIDALTDDEKDAVRGLLRTFQYQNFLSITGDARQIIKETQQSITDEFYETYIEAVFGVREGDVRSERSLIGDGVVAPDDATGDERRLFAVKVMNRLIFIKFLEDKRIVQEDLLRELQQTYDDNVYPDSLYKTFVERLFFDVMNERPDDRGEQLASIDMFEGIPYLNGGLFRPSLDEDSDITERDFDVRDSVLEDIIRLLEQYEFSADGGPTDLDPSVLGNIFEKTINYITTDPADQNKELGAYYTPSEITRFSAERTVLPALYDRFKPIVQEELGWPDETFDKYDSLYPLIEALPADMSVLGPLLEETDEFRVVDPAMGSGHFLTSVLEEIVSVRKALYAQNDSYPPEFRLRKTTVQNNIYGVDIVGPAVEIGKLRLWLSTIADLSEEDVDEFDAGELALPNIAFNLRQGNSLIGYTGFPEESGNGEYTLGKFSKQSVRDRYDNIITEIHRYEQAIGEDAETHREKAYEYLENARDELIPKIQRDFNDAGVEGITKQKVRELDPFNWVLEFAEVYADGGFDVIVGNPPWDQITPQRDDYFTRYDSGFRTLLPEAKKKRQAELLEDPEIQEGWEEYKRNIEIQAEYFNNSEDYELQRPTVAGRTEATENDLSALFLERVFQIARNDGYVSQVLPGAIFNGSSAKDLRLHLLDETRIDSLVTFENKGIFPEIDDRYNFGVLVFENRGMTETLRGMFKQHGVDVLQQFEEQALSIPRQVLREYSPEAAIFPYVNSEMEVQILNTIFQHPPVSAPINQTWRLDPYRELDRRNDDDRFVEDSDKGDYPVIGGRNMYQFMHDATLLEDLEDPQFWSVEEEKDPDLSAKRRIREKKLRSLKRGIYDAFDGTGSQKSFVNDLLNEKRGEELLLEDVLLDCTEYRIVIRNIARATDERTMIASVIPPNVVCHHAINTMKRFEVNPEGGDLTETPLHTVYDSIFTDEELFVAVGLLNSIPFDFLMRTKVDSNIVMYKLEESQLPRLSEGDKWFRYISERAARLNCYGEEFKDMRERLGGVNPVTDSSERRPVQAELDAAAFHAYGLNREQTVFVLENFYKVQDPRVMDDDYFDLVIEKYDELVE